LLQDLQDSGGGRAEKCFGAHRRNFFGDGHINEVAGIRLRTGCPGALRLSPSLQPERVIDCLKD
jgi:hypothetical protein